MTKYRLLTRLIRLMAPLYRKLLLAVLCAVAGFFASIAIPYVLIQTVFSVWQQQETHVILVTVLLVLLAVARGLLRYGEHYFGHYIAFRVLAEFRGLVFRKLRRLAPARLDKQDSGILLKMIGEDIEAVEVFFAHTLPPISTAILVTLVLGGYYMNVSFGVLVIALVTYVLLAIVLPIYFAKVLQPLMQQQASSRKDYTSYFLDSLKGMKDLVQYGTADARFKILQDKSQAVNRYEKRVYQGQHQQTALTYLVVGLSVFAMALSVFQSVQAQHMTLVSAVSVLVVFSMSFAPYLELSRLPFGLKKALKAASDIFELLDEPEMAQTGQDALEQLTAVSMTDVSFQYPNRDQWIFQQQSFSVVLEGDQKIVGIVGGSGSGKSTLMKLIMRWYDVQSGQIVLDAHDSTTLLRESIQAKVAYIPQVPQLFAKTIRENLVLGKPIADDDILKVAEKCHIKERILQLPNGLDTVIPPEQTLFSSGEMQRLELTRALLKDADCYVFDEPTSYLDALNEAAFLNVMKNECKGLIFLISHRPSTVSCADVVFEIDDKQIVRIKG